MKRPAPAWEPIPELLRAMWPECAGKVQRVEKWQDDDDDQKATVLRCPNQAVWYRTETGSPYCDAHKEQLERIEHHQEITPP